MKTSSVAKSYARALFGDSEEEKSLIKDFKGTAEMILSHENLKAVLFSDAFSKAEKLSVLDGLFSKQAVSKRCQLFFELLTKKGRLKNLAEILSLSNAIENEKAGFVCAQVRGVSESLSPEVETQIKTFLRERYKLQVNIDYQEDLELGAGLKIIAGDILLDASLENQLGRFKDFVLNS